MKNSEPDSRTPARPGSDSECECRSRPPSSSHAGIKLCICHHCRRIASAQATQAGPPPPAAQIPPRLFQLGQRAVGCRVADVELVLVREGATQRALYGRCTHRNARLAEGTVEGDVLVCAYHGWDYHGDYGRCRSDESEALQVFALEERDAGLWVDAAEVQRWRLATPLDFYDDELDP